MPNTVSLNPELVATGRPISLEHLGGWSNTGYLEIELRPAEASAPDANSATKFAVLEEAASSVTGAHATGESIHGSLEVDPEGPVDAADAQGSHSRSAPQLFQMLIKTINGKDHLQGLKRTGGGVGSAKHDEGQKSIESFFKRRKT